MVSRQEETEARPLGRTGEGRDAGFVSLSIGPAVNHVYQWLMEEAVLVPWSAEGLGRKMLLHE